MELIICCVSNGKTSENVPMNYVAWSIQGHYIYLLWSRGFTISLKLIGWVVCLLFELHSLGINSISYNQNGDTYVLPFLKFMVLINWHAYQ